MNIFSKFFQLKNKIVSTIYIIEDNRIFSKQLEKKISNELNGNFEIKTFVAGELIFMADTKPDYAIVDYQLNTKYYDAQNGLEIALTLKSISDRTKIVLISSNLNQEEVQMIKQNYGLDVIFKNDDLVQNIVNFFKF